MSNLITAEEAKTLASKARELNINSERNDILKEIKRLATVGRTQHWVSVHPLSWGTKDTEFFTNLGYTVEKNSYRNSFDYNQKQTTVRISWDK